MSECRLLLNAKSEIFSYIMARTSYIKEEHTFNETESVDSEHSGFDHEKDTVHQPSSKI